MERHKYGGFFSNPDKKEPSPSFQCSTRRGRPSGVSKTSAKPSLVFRSDCRTEDGYCPIVSYTAWWISHLGLTCSGVCFGVAGVFLYESVVYCVFGIVLSTFSIGSWTVLGDMIQIRKGEE